MKFLIIKLSSLGDIIHTLPVVYKLRQSYPEAQIDWLVGIKGFEFLKLVNEINNVYLFDLKSIFLIQKQRYDYIIDVQGLFKSAFVSRLCLGKKIIGFKNTREFADIFYDQKIDVGPLFKTKRHVVDLNLELISNLSDKKEKIKFLIPKILKSDIQKILNETENKNCPKVVIFPSTTWESKLWKMDYWFELIKKMAQNFQIYICATKADLHFIKPLIDELELNKINYKNLIGKTSIQDLIYLIQNVDLIIGLDSAGLHLASAVKNDYNSPEVIGIYGPTSLYRSGPYNLSENCLYLSELDCIACRKKMCPLGHHNCMNNILSSDVLEVVNGRLGKCIKV